jgi:glycosyltransferase involved in cell wall biosynthesis
MDIVIVSQYLRDIEYFENNNNRFVYIAKLLATSKENNIEIITSDFNHTKKEKFNKIGKMDGIKITACHETGYPKNICLKRFNSHRKLSKNIKAYLEKRKRPDIIYCAIPSLAVGKIVAQYAERNNVRFIIDVQDLWPEAFKMVFNIPIISNIIFYPMKREADYIYARADDIVAVSETYCNRALMVNKKVGQGLSVFLGTDLKYFDKCAEKNKVEFNDNMVRIAYIGTLGHSYDIPLVIDSIKYLNEKGINNLKFIIMGDGPLKEEFEDYAEEKKVDCQFTGRLEYEKMVGLLCSCDIAVNPIKKGSAGSIINKVGDYAAAGLAVVNSQENEEYRKIVECYGIGFNTKNDDVIDFAKKLEFLIVNIEQRKKMGNMNRKLSENKFNRNNTYKKIIQLILEGEN